MTLSESNTTTTKRSPIVEKYVTEIAKAAPIYESTHGRKMNAEAKVATAQLLENLNSFFDTTLSNSLNEAFGENSVGTQRSDMGAYKKFCLAVTNVTFPSLIAEDLVMVYPMTSISGAVTYAKYTYGSSKGGIEQGQTIATPWEISERTTANQNYTGPAVSESYTVTDDSTITLKWRPISSIVKVLDGGEEVSSDNYSFDATTGVVTFTGGVSASDTVDVLYVYDNVYIPQNDLPVINVSMEVIPLVAHARRVAVYYSQIAAFQAQTDYGFDISKTLAERACAELSYEIDEEIVDLLAGLGDANEIEDANFNKALPVGVSKKEWYEGFLENVETARSALYKRTQKFYPSYMLVATDVLPILSLISSWKPENRNAVAGPFFAGTLDGLKVFCSPRLTAGKVYLGVNGKDMQTSAAVYAPYMPIVPTQLLGYADGGMSQGFSTMYDLKVLNDHLVISFKVYSDVEEARALWTHTADSTGDTGDTGGEELPG